MPATGFVKAASNNIPKVDVFMVSEYIKNDARFTSAEIRGVKATASTCEQYGDNAIGYVELKREGNLCNLQCKVCPEHKVRSKNYTVCMTIDEAKEEVVNVECKDCAAAAGGCKHALAFLMWMHRRSEEPSPTDVTSYWKKPLLSGVGTSLQFVTASAFGKQSTTIQPQAASHFLEELVALAASEQLEGQIMRHACSSYSEPFEKLFIYKLLLKFVEEGGETCDNFLRYASTQMTDDLCRDAVKSSEGQSNSPLWHELRFGRITASKIHDIVCKCTTSDGTLIEGVIGAYKVHDTKYMKRGRLLEREVLLEVEKKLRRKWRQQSGFFTLPFLPILGASPDGLTAEYVIEVKCPSSEKTFNLYIKKNEITPKFKAQITLQMLCSGRKKALFCVTKHEFEHTMNFETIEYHFDKEFCDKLISSAMTNWKEFVFPKLYASCK